MISNSVLSEMEKRGRFFFGFILAKVYYSRKNMLIFHNFSCHVIIIIILKTEQTILISLKSQKGEDKLYFSLLSTPHRFFSPSFLILVPFATIFPLRIFRHSSFFLLQLIKNYRSLEPGNETGKLRKSALFLDSNPRSPSPSILLTCDKCGENLWKKCMSYVLHPF